MIQQLRQPGRSFREMTPKQREAARRKMMAIRVTDEEICQWDPMVFKTIKNVILRYWSNGNAHWGPNSTYEEPIIERLGMSVSDLMQCGRMFVCNQIRWYKLYGDPDGSQLGTLIFQYLNHKFQNMSRVAANKKHGGPVVGIKRGRKVIQTFLDTFDDGLSVTENSKLLHEAIGEMSHSFKKNIPSTFKSNDAMKEFLYEIVVNMDVLTFHNYEDVEPYMDVQRPMDPEEALLIKESVVERIRNLSLREREEARCRRPAFVVLAKEMGITSMVKLAKQLGTSLATLEKVVRRSKEVGPNTYEKVTGAMEKMFGLPITELLKEVE